MACDQYCCCCLLAVSSLLCTDTGSVTRA
uniref:Uncharacterized protein n=1 Tax=Arundo donax TaxID=35708 RepID=A0A0A9EZW8_ARUDO